VGIIEIDPSKEKEKAMTIKLLEFPRKWSSPGKVDTKIRWYNTTKEVHDDDKESTLQPRVQDRGCQVGHPRVRFPKKSGQ
jgi:hypothetical protein